MTRAEIHAALGAGQRVVCDRGEVVYPWPSERVLCVLKLGQSAQWELRPSDLETARVLEQTREQT